MKIFPLFRRALVVAGLAVAGFALYLTAAQAGMIYFPSAYSKADLEAMGRDGLRRIEFASPQGKQVAFYKGPATGVPAKVWLVFCGNGARSADYRDIAVRDDFGYLFVDYPGYGSSEGKPGPRRIDGAVAGAVVALAAELGAGADELRGNLCAFGHSLGAAVALRSAVAFGIDEVVIVSPFTSMKSMAARAVGKALSNVLLHRFDNIKALSDLTAADPDVRVTLFHGKEDRGGAVRDGGGAEGAVPEDHHLRAGRGLRAQRYRRPPGGGDHRGDGKITATAVRCRAPRQPWSAAAEESRRFLVTPCFDCPRNG